MENNSLTQPSESPKKNFLVIFLVILILIAIVELALFLNKRGQAPFAATTMEEQVAVSPTDDALLEGSFKMSSATQSASIGVPLTFTIKVDSNKRGVVGMDAVVSYDETAFTTGPVRTSLAGFSAISSTRKNYLEMTAAKDPQTFVTPVLSDTEVFIFTLTPKKVGSFKVELLEKADKSSTKFIDADTKIYLPKVDSVMVTVK